MTAPIDYTIDQLINTCTKAIADCPDAVLSMRADLLLTVFDAVKRSGFRVAPRYTVGELVMYEGRQVQIRARDFRGDGLQAYVYMVTGVNDWQMEDDLQPIKNGVRHGG
jgi:hypothetical protein